MAIAGLRGTGDWGTDERPKNFREMILWLSPNGQTPLLGLSSKMQKSTTNDPEFAWWEEVLSIVRLQINGALTNVATAIVVDNGLNGLTASDLKVGDLMLVENVEDTTYTAEIIQVAALVSATQFTGTRGVAGSTGAAISDNWFITKIGSAFEEGTVKPTAVTRNPTKFKNYTQIFKDLYSITGTAKATNARTGDPVANDKKRKVFDHSTGIELAAFFGKPFETTGAGGKPLRYTGGFLSFLAAASRVDIATAMTGSGATGINLFFDTIQDVFDYSVGGNAGDERICFAGNTALMALNKAVRTMSSGTDLGEIVKVYGMNLAKLVIPQGTLYIKGHPLMNQHGRYTNSLFVIDPTGIRYRPLQGRDTKATDGVQTPGQDSTDGQWMTECGFEFNHMQTAKYLGAISWS